MRLLRHLGEDAFGDVVVAPPVGRTLGIGELVEIIAAGLGSNPGRDNTGFGRGFRKLAASAQPLDRRYLLRAGRARHHRDEGQPEQPREISLADGRRSGR